MFFRPKTFLAKVLARLHPLLRPLLPHRHVVCRVSGSRIYLDLSESPMMLERALGLYEVEEQALLRRFLGPGMTFVDAGANKGDFTLLAARLVGPKGRVVAIEPEPRNRHWLERSIALNGYGNVEVVHAALSDEHGETTLHLSELSGHHTLLSDRPGRDAGALRVETSRLDSLLGSHPIDFLKLDVEGAELLALAGATRILAREEPLVVLVEIHPELGVDPGEVESLLAGYGFGFDPPTDVEPRSEGPTRKLLALRGPT